MIRGSGLISLVLFAGCGNNEGADPDVVRLDWRNGDEFHVAARYRVVSPKTEENAVALDGSTDPTFGDAWTNEVVWSYQVVETGFSPTQDDELYEFAVEGEGVTPISVIRAWTDASLNEDDDLLESDPVIYLVFREQNDRLLAIVQFVNVGGERVQTAWKDTDTTRSWSPLSQSMITGLPTLLAPAGARWATDERLLENGDTMTSEEVDGGTAVYFDDAIGGGMIMTEYTAGQPWPIYTATDNLEASLLSSDEVARRRSDRPWQLPDVPENFDYKAALRSSIDINGALKLDAETIGGGWEAVVADGVYPWGGSWWPLAQASLVFGYDNRSTFSDRVASQIDPIKRDLDRLSTELRPMTGSESNYTTKYNEYKSKQTELSTKLKTFYDKILADLDGGKIKLGNGKITHSVDGWSYNLNDLSPMDKFALSQYYKGNKYPNPFNMQAWELLNHYNPGGGSWWGHCNGWSGAAILTNEPRTPVIVQINGQPVTFTTADIKGLFTEAHYSTYSSFYGARYNGTTDDISDLSPKAFHILVNHYIRQRRVPFVFDITADDAVWNYPVYGVDLTVTEVAGAGADGKTNLNTADRVQLDALPGIGLVTADKIIAYRTTYGAFQVIDDVKKVPGMKTSYFDKFKGQVTVAVATGERTFNVSAYARFADDGVSETHLDSSPSTPETLDRTWEYTLVTDKDGNVLRGTWADNNEHPDFAWVPYDNPTTTSSGNSENAYLSYGKLLEVVGTSLRR